MVNETTLSKDFMTCLMNRLSGITHQAFRHVEQFSHGVPDWSVTVGYKTLWIEFKAMNAGKPSTLKYRPGQQQTLPKLGNCLLVVFVVNDEGLHDVVRFWTRNGLPDAQQVLARMRPEAGRLKKKSDYFHDSLETCQNFLLD